MTTFWLVLALAVKPGFGLGGNPRGPLGGQYGVPTSKDTTVYFAPTSGLGLLSDVAPNICDQLTPGEKAAGKYWCINGATADDAGTVQMNRTSAPMETNTIYGCVGSPNCVAYTGIRNTTGQGGGGGALFRSTAFDAGAGALNTPFTACAFYVAGITGSGDGNQTLIRFGADSDVNSKPVKFLLKANGASSQFSTTGGISTCDGGAAGGFVNGVVPGSLAFGCARFDGGLGVLEAFVNDTKYTSGAVAPACTGGTSAQHLYGGVFNSGFDGGSMVKASYILGGFYVETYLDDSRLSAIANSVRGSPLVSSSKGQRLFNGRTSSKSCEQDGGQTITTLLAGESCITSGGISVEKSATNNLKMSEEFDNGSYWAISAPGSSLSVIKNGAKSPSNQYVAEVLNLGQSVSGASSAVIYQPSACPVGKVVASVYVTGIATNGAIQMYINNGSAYVCTSCPVVNGVTSRCTLNTTVASNGSLSIGNEASSPCPTTTRTSQVVSVWGAQCELDRGDGKPSSYIYTSSATATRAADAPYFYLPKRLPSAPISIASSWLSWPTGEALGATGNNVGLVSVEDSDAGVSISSLTIFGDTASYISGGLDGGNQLLVDTTSETGNVSIWGWTDKNYVSSFSASTESVGPYTGSDSPRSVDVVKIGWGTGMAQPNTVIKNVCVSTGTAKCR
jgi:hypothetical protein